MSERDDMQPVDATSNQNDETATNSDSAKEVHADGVAVEPENRAIEPTGSARSANSTGSAISADSTGATGTTEPAGSTDLANMPDRTETNAARAVGAFFAEGVASMKEMSAAHRAHSEARGELERLDNTIAARERELARRRDIESRYDEIVAEETARKNAAVQTREAAEERRAAIAAEVAELKNNLEKMRGEDASVERRLKSAVDAAEDKERSSRESGKRLQRRLDDAQENLERTVKEHDEGVSTAQQTVKSAESLLATLNAEYAEIQRNPSANPAGYSVRKRELEDEISDAACALRTAKDDVPRIEQETQAAIDEARAAVAEAEKPMASAREAFNAVAAAADRARDAYSEAKDDAEKRQKKLRGEISEREKEAKAEEHAAQVAQKEADAAQSTLDEANEIHAHPEATASLAHALEADRAERIDRVAEVEELAAAEKTVRERTRGARLKLVLAIASIVLVVVLMLVWTYLAQ